MIVYFTPSSGADICQVAEHPNYKGYVTVFLETVLYLDYRLLSPEDREAGLTTFREDLHALVQEEKEVEADRARSIASEHDHQRLVDAHVDAYAGACQDVGGRGGGRMAPEGVG